MKLLIIDDHPLLREGLAEVLRQSQPETTVLQARDVDQGLAMAGQIQDLDAIFLDLNFTERGAASANGLSALPQFSRQFPDVPVIILSSSEDPVDVRRALAQGAMGYVPKSTSAHTLLSALRLVLSGNIYLPPLLAEAPVESPSATGTRGLTDRQQEVLEAICQGLSNKEIGIRLALSEKTVKAHVSAIFRVLNVVNRTQAVNVARNAKLVAN